jgi:hypothetical protein
MGFGGLEVHSLIHRPEAIQELPPCHPTGKLGPSFFRLSSSRAWAWAGRPRNLNYKIAKNVYLAASGQK